MFSIPCSISDAPGHCHIMLCFAYHCFSFFCSLTSLLGVTFNLAVYLDLTLVMLRVIFRVSIIICASVAAQMFNHFSLISLLNLSILNFICHYVPCSLTWLNPAEGLHSFIRTSYKSISVICTIFCLLSCCSLPRILINLLCIT